MLCDVSESMGEDLKDGRKRIDHLVSALAQIIPSVMAHRLYAFSSFVREIDDIDDMPFPSGGTAMHFAIDAAAAINAERTLLFTDGEPEDEDAALHAARNLTGRLDVVFCSSEDNQSALAFLRRLACAGRGAVTVHDFNGLALLAPKVRQLLALPGPRA